MKNIICIFIVFLFTIVNVNAWSCRCSNAAITTNCCSDWGWKISFSGTTHCYNIDANERDSFKSCCNRWASFDKCYQLNIF